MFTSCHRQRIPCFRKRGHVNQDMQNLSTVQKVLQKALLHIERVNTTVQLHTGAQLWKLEYKIPGELPRSTCNRATFKSKVPKLNNLFQSYGCICIHNFRTDLFISILKSVGRFFPSSGDQPCHRGLHPERTGRQDKL